MMIMVDNGSGRLWNTEVNETCQDSKIPDASKFRVGAPYVEGESGGGGAISFDVLEQPDTPNGRRVEVVGIGGAMNQQRGGELGIWCLKAGAEISDANQIKVAEMRAEGIEFKVPISAPNMSHASGTPAFMQSPDGRWRTQQQDDGNFVTYDMFAPGGPKAVWSAWTGRIPGTNIHGVVEEA